MKPIDKSILSHKICLIRGFMQFLDKFSILLEDLDPFIDEEMIKDD